jgi:hypothetical protein
MLDGAILAGGIHGLEDEQHGPAVLRVKDVLQFGERLDTVFQSFLGAGLVFRREIARISRIDILETKLFAVSNAIRFGNLPGDFDDLFGFYGGREM